MYITYSFYFFCKSEKIEFKHLLEIYDLKSGNLVPKPL